MAQLILAFLFGLLQLCLVLVFVVDVLEEIVHDNFIGRIINKANLFQGGVGNK